MDDEYLTNEEKADALSRPIKDIILELSAMKERLEDDVSTWYNANDKNLIQLYFAIIYHLEQAYKNKAEYY